MPVNERFVHASFSYLANFSQPSYASQEVTKLEDTLTKSAPYANADYHNSALYVTTLNSSWINENSASAHVPSLNNAAYKSSPTQLQSSGSTHVPLPKRSKSIIEQWVDVGCETLVPWGFWLLLILGGCKIERLYTHHSRIPCSTIFLEVLIKFSNKNKFFKWCS
jgi:hypothetical protein